MNRYKGIFYWYNDLQGLWMAQEGYTILFTANTESALKCKITNYIKKG